MKKKPPKKKQKETLEYKIYRILSLMEDRGIF